MPDFAVQQFVDDFLRTDSAEAARNILGVQATNYLSISSISSNYTILSSDANSLLTYSGTQNISAYITNNINTAGFNTTISQLSSGTVSLLLSSGYSANRISYSNLYTTAGIGAMISLIRVSNNTFLVSGLLQ
jgi:hypothetical protein